MWYFRKMNLKQIQLTTDGACCPNPGRGGWAAIIRYKSSYKELTGSSPKSTNNRMELTAIMEGLRALKEPCRVMVRTDSRTCLAWCDPLSFKKVRARQKHPIVFAMVEELRRISARHEVTYIWLKGHAGDPDNERCDELAEDACRRPF